MLEDKQKRIEEAVKTLWTWISKNEYLARAQFEDYPSDEALKDLDRYTTVEELYTLLSEYKSVVYILMKTADEINNRALDKLQAREFLHQSTDRLIHLAYKNCRDIAALPVDDEEDCE